MGTKIAKYECVWDTSDHERMYVRGQIYDMPDDHPCLEHFRLVDEAAAPTNPGPATPEGVE